MSDKTLIKIPDNGLNFKYQAKSITEILERNKKVYYISHVKEYFLYTKYTKEN